MYNYRELKIWQRSIDLVEKVYLETLNLAADEKFGLKVRNEDVLFRYRVILPKVLEGIQTNNLSIF